MKTDSLRFTHVFAGTFPALIAALGVFASTPAWAVSDIVISQVYGGGGNSGATYTHDFIELYNRGTNSVNLAGWSVQYASTTGTSWTNKTDLSGTLAPGQYYLIQEATNAAVGGPLPTPDLSGTIAMSAANGKLVLLNTTTAVTAGTACPTGASVLDIVGYGNSTNCFEGAGPTTPNISATVAAVRLGSGATDTDNNSADFANGVPTPRNSTTTSASVSITASDPSASELGANPGSVTVARTGGNTTLALNVSVLVSGTASNGTDYTPLLLTPVTIPANQTATVVTLTPVNDAAAEGTEVAIVTLLAGSGYTLGASSAATVTLADDDAVDTAPTVASTNPVNDAVNVLLNNALQVNFSEQVDVTANAVTVECPAGNVVASSAPASNVNSLVIAPVWPANTLCVINVAANGMTDVDNTDPPNNMAANYSGTFTTTSNVCTAVDTPIGQIQGTGASFALGGVQTVQGVVVGDYEGADPALRGFYLQNTPANDDDNSATSDGLFIFNNNNSNVVVGQVVQVTGSVSDFGFGSTGGTQTQISATAIEACGTGTLAPTDLNLPFPSSTDSERFEGMLVRFPQTLYVSEHFQLGRFGQVLLSGTARLPQPTNIALPGAPALAQQTSNDLNQIFLDDEQQLQNPDPIRFARSGNPLTAANTLRGGDTVTAIQGVLTQTDATTAGSVPATSDPVLYRLRPFNALNAQTPNFIAVNQRPAAPAAISGSTLRIAGFNLLNYFNTFGLTNCANGVGGTVAECRGAENTAEFDRQWAKTVQAALGTQADVLVVNEIENDGYGPASAIQDLVNKLNAASTPGTYAFINPDATLGVNSLGTDAIKVGMIYQPGRLTPVGTTAAANTGAFGLYTTGSGILGRNRPALAQAFQENGTNARVVVVANHLKSKGSACDGNISPVGPDPDALDGQGNCNLTRTAGAAQLVTWLNGDPTGTGTLNTLIMGDLNAYAFENPITTLTGAGYVNLVASRLGMNAYSYVFDGQWGYLDHALASPALNAQVVGVEEWHINADEPNVLGYDMNFKSAGQISSLFAVDQYRTSDHDVVLVGLALDTDGDGLGDSLETVLGTNPLDADSDDDGLTDGAEDANHNGALDSGETNASHSDSDGDGIQDGTEAGVTIGIADPDGGGPLLGTAGGFVADVNPRTTTSALDSDTDNDGFSDGQEDTNHNGAIDGAESDPNNAASTPQAVQKVPFIPGWALVLLACVLTVMMARRQRG